MNISIAENIKKLSFKFIYQNFKYGDNYNVRYDVCTKKVLVIYGGYMDNLVVNHLNTLFKGEQMAVESYEKFIQSSEDEKIKSSLQEIQRDHKEHAAKLAERIQSVGGKPEYGTGLTGVISNLRLSLETRNKNDSIEILKRAYDGEDKGIAMAEKVVKSELDEESKKLLDGILSADHDHLKSMLSLLTEYGYKNQVH